MRPPAGSSWIAAWLCSSLACAALVVWDNLRERKRGRWTRRYGLGSVLVLVILLAILAGIVWPVYTSEVIKRDVARFHRLHPHLHYVD